jgi:uncharacterized protein YodC (DUF2158 family)
MEEKFKIGDVVQLKSGGPKMTVQNTTTYSFMGDPMPFSGQIDCAWFENVKSHTGKFHQDMLDKVEHKN